MPPRKRGWGRDGVVASHAHEAQTTNITRTSEGSFSNAHSTGRNLYLPYHSRPFAMLRASKGGEIEEGFFL